MTFLKIASTAICAFIGMFGASASIMAVAILVVVGMFFSDIWRAVKPITRRRRFQ